MCAYSRAGQQAHSRSSSPRHGSRCQAWPSTTLGRPWCPTHPWEPRSPTVNKLLAGGEFSLTRLCEFMLRFKAQLQVSLMLNASFLFTGVVMEASTMESASRTLVLAVTLPPRATTQGPLTPDPNRARGQRLDMQRAEPGILSDRHTSTLSAYFWGAGRP